MNKGAVMVYAASKTSKMHYANLRIKKADWLFRLMSGGRFEDREDKRIVI